MNWLFFFPLFFRSSISDDYEIQLQISFNNCDRMITVFYMSNMSICRDCERNESFFLHWSNEKRYGIEYLKKSPRLNLAFASQKIRFSMRILSDYFLRTRYTLLLTLSSPKRISVGPRIQQYSIQELRRK